MVFFNEAAIYYFIVQRNSVYRFVAVRLLYVIYMYITICGNSVYGMYHLGCHILFQCSLHHVGTLYMVCII